MGRECMTSVWEGAGRSLQGTPRLAAPDNAAIYYARLLSVVQEALIVRNMKRPAQLVERSYSMMISSYWLARCGIRHQEKAATPPAALDVGKWKAAYDSFFDAMGDGRSPAQFRNSMKNARDTFDILFDNGRIGWVDRNGKQPSMSASFRRVQEEWKERSDEELERFVLGLQAGMPVAVERTARGHEARTEGGERVYLSMRRERDPKLRDDAITLHGLDCMACGFNFSRIYGAIGEGFVEVHHVIPLAEAGLSVTDPTTDLIVLCANCHRMVHRQSGVCLSLGELKAHLESCKLPR